MSRRGLPHHVLRIGAVAAVTLALVGYFTSDAHAATPVRTPCGSVVTWGVGASLTGPKTLPDDIGAACALVAPVAGLQVTPAAGTPTIRWVAIDRGVGDTTAVGDSETTTWLSPTVIWQHADLPAALTADRVLRDVLHDVGVPSPTSTGGVLSPADASAIQAACAEQAANTAPASATTGAPVGPGTPDTTTTVVAAPVAPTLGAPGVPVGLAVGAIAIAVGVWLPLGAASTRLAPIAASLRARLPKGGRG